jgi:DNA-binding IscR family transcriptional regulator
MRRDSRLSVALHTLLHLADREGVVTSDALGGMMETNGAVMRRTMAGLRAAGIVRAEKGHGGGWALARPLDQVTLADVYEALGITTIFAMGPRTESPGCIVEQAVNRATGEAFDAAAAVLVERLAQVKLSALAAEIARQHPRHAARRAHDGRKTKGRSHHA